MNVIQRDSAFYLPATTLPEILQYHAQTQPKRVVFTFLKDGEEEGHLTFGDLYWQAQTIATYLQQHCSPGERALLLYPAGLSFIAAFFGCLFAGVIAVPAYPPHAKRQSVMIAQKIAADSQATVILTTTSLFKRLTSSEHDDGTFSSMHFLATDAVSPIARSEWHISPISQQHLAFLQYTSGSTGTPKGVMVSHSNLMSNLELMRQCFGLSPSSQTVIWLPPYHDMGLVGGILQPVCVGYPTVLMDSLSFIQRPIRWLEAISRYRATTSGGPNFAYDHCLRRITTEQREQLDLSSWDVAFNGAEKVQAETLEKFAQMFAPCGFRREAFYPCYGMAEATLFVSGGMKTAQPIFRSVEGQTLTSHHMAENTSRMSSLVSCGKAWLDHHISIVDPQARLPLPDGQIGEIWISGPSIAQGYWNQPDLTRNTFSASLANDTQPIFLRSGDLGVMYDGELFVTGRLKELIIIRGRNYYPQDIEKTVEEGCPALHEGCGMAFSVEVDREERLVVAYEVKRDQQKTLEIEKVLQSICQAVHQRHDLQVYAVVLLKVGQTPKTSSGRSNAT